MKATTAAAGLACVSCACVTASAHTVIPGVGGLTGGLVHPALVPAHVLALTALGLLAGQQPPRTRRTVLASFAAGLAAGVGAIVSAFAADDPDMIVLACAAATALLVVAARPLPRGIPAAAAAVAGVAIILDSVPQEISVSATVLALGGTFVTALLALMLAAWLAARGMRPWQQVGIRILGSWIAASAILVLALRIGA